MFTKKIFFLIVAPLKCATENNTQKLLSQKDLNPLSHSDSRYHSSTAHQKNNESPSKKPVEPIYMELPIETENRLPSIQPKSNNNSQKNSRRNSETSIFSNTPPPVPARPSYTFLSSQNSYKQINEPIYETLNISNNTPTDSSQVSAESLKPPPINMKSHPKASNLEKQRHLIETTKAIEIQNAEIQNAEIDETLKNVAKRLENKKNRDEYFNSLKKMEPKPKPADVKPPDSKKKLQKYKYGKKPLRPINILKK